MAELPTGGAGATGGGSSTQMSLAFNTRNNLYPNPFLDVTSVSLPKRIKGIFNFCAVIVFSDGIVSQCVAKLSEYPITDIRYNEKRSPDEEPSSELKGDQFQNWWKNMFEKTLKIKRVLIDSNSLYYTYGNAVSSIHYPFRRELECPKCKERLHAKGDSYKFKNMKFYATCKGLVGEQGNQRKCGYEGEMKPFDVDIKDERGIKIIFWDLNQIDIKFNNLTGNHTYLYDVPKHLRAKIRMGDRDYIEDTRLIFIEAVQKNKKIKLDANNVFHFKRPGPQFLIPEERGWGIPALLPSMKDYYHYQILRKGNEMIAFDHIIPLRILFPQGTGDVSPHGSTNLGSWHANIESEIQKWRQDQNYVSIMPIPVGIETFSGNGRLLMATSELELTENRIIVGMGMQPEIIKGGATWSGGNVSLRTTENHFLTNRMFMEEYLEWIADNISAYMNKPGIRPEFTSFKMADDVQVKQLMLQMNQAPGSQKKISDETLMSEFGISSKEELDKIRKEMKILAGVEREFQIAQAEINGKVQYVLGLFNAQAGNEAQKLQLKLQKKSQQEQLEEKMQGDDQTAQVAAEELSKQTGKTDGVELSQLVNQFTLQFAQLGKIDPETQKEKLFILKQTMPNLFMVIFENLKELNLIGFELTPEILSQFINPKTGLAEVPDATQGGTTPMQQPGAAETMPTANAKTSALVSSPPEQKQPKGESDGTKKL